MRKLIVFGNWKMNTDARGAVELAGAVGEGVKGTSVEVGVAPPFVYLSAVGQAVKDTNVALAGQNVYFETAGAFTGEVNVDMLLDVGASHVIIGHSERRHVMGESDELINRKVKASLEGRLAVILCVGELLEEREAGKTRDVLRRQITSGLVGVSLDAGRKLILAYEPVWAIGTGKTATAEQAQEAHAFIRGLLAEAYGEAKAEDIQIQYGGSVKPKNAYELLSQADVDGALVGGASLEADSFVAIVSEAAKVTEKN